MNTQKIVLIIAVLVITLFIVGCSKATEGLTDKDKKITVYKSPTCGCCTIYTQYLDAQGFDVTIIQQANLEPIKKQFHVPSEILSCHTSVISGYFVEGHVPAEAIVKLLTEKPTDIVGIGMSGMPSGSPGMPGVKSGPFIVYAAHTDGTVTEFMRI